MFILSHKVQGICHCVIGARWCYTHGSFLIQQDLTDSSSLWGHESWNLGPYGAMWIKWWMVDRCLCFLVMVACHWGNHKCNEFGVEMHIVCWLRICVYTDCVYLKWNIQTEHQFLHVSVRHLCVNVCLFLWGRLYMLIVHFHCLFMHLECTWEVSVKSGNFPCMWTLFSQWNTLEFKAELNNISCVRGPPTTSGQASVQI